MFVLSCLCRLPYVPFFQIRGYYVQPRIRFSLRDKRLFEIIEVEITRVDCILEIPTTLQRHECAMFVLSCLCRLPYVPFFQIRGYYVQTRIRFSLRDKRLFEIIEVEITRVDCILEIPTTLQRHECAIFVLSCLCRLPYVPFFQIRGYFACSRCRWGLFEHFYSRLSFLSSFSLSWTRLNID